MSGSTPSLLPILFFVFAFCLSQNGVFAFGAGNIASFAYMEGKAFRHGDIEDVLETLVKTTSGFAMANIIGKGRKFNGLDIKRVYLGNWLRDYSQAVDIATLKKMPLQTIINLLMVLGFMAHGYATNEFEITEERLGCYLPTEHIDNPKGYGDGEDARKYHPGLRGPVDPRELEIDPRTGMKNYIANESGHWDTSKALVRRLLEKCIHHGRQHRANGQKADEYESYRLLGTLLHTLEDFPAHSNFCELTLVGMGHQEVFTHVGDSVRVQAPNGKWVAPIVTGSFGSDDFFHSLLGGATDSLSEASVTDLNKEMDKARSKAMSNTRGPGGAPSDPGDVLRDLFFTLPGGDSHEMSRDLDNINRIRAGPAQGGKRPEDMSPKELHSVLWQILMFRDSVVKKISKTIEKIPGLGPLIDKLMDGISVFIFTTLEPFMKPLLQGATTSLNSISAEVIDKHDQYEVFNDPRASDPTHSFLAKDHFNLILNEPAGQVARVIVINTVELVAKAWDDNSVNVHHVSEEILQCMFHPEFHNPQSKVQREMLQCMKDWYTKHPKQKDTLHRLSKNCVRNHEHVRGSGEGGKPSTAGSFGDVQGHNMQHKIQGYAQNLPGYGVAQEMFGGQGYAKDSSGGYGQQGSAPGGQSSYGAAPPTSGEAASYYNTSGGSKPPGIPSGGGHQHGAPPTPAYGGPPSIPSAYGAPSAHSHVAPNRPGYSPSYEQPPQFGGGGGYASPSAPPSHHHHQAPGFPGPAPSFPSGHMNPSGPGFPGAPPSFPGGGPPGFPGGGGGPHGARGFPASPGGYGADPGYGAPAFPGGPPPPQGFPSADPYAGGHAQGHPHGHGHGGPPGFPGAPGGW